MRHRKTIMFGIVAAAVAALCLQHPSADIRILTHESDDLQPHKMQAAIDTGLFAVNLLVTWTAHAVR